MQRPRIALTLAAALSACLLSSCATAPAHRHVAADQPFTMVPGGSVALPDASTLRYVAVIADSRCPLSVVCIHAGNADVAFGYTAPGATEQRMTIDTDATAPTPIGRWQLRLVALARGEAPAATLQVTAR